MKQYPSKYKALFTLSTLFILALLLIPLQKDVIFFTKTHPYLSPLIIILWRVIAIIIPPIPGGIISLVFIPILGWFWSFIYGITSVLLGTSAAFFLGRYLKEPFVKHFLPIKQIEILEQRLSKKQEFFALFIIRITTGSFFDFVSYVAGMTNLKYRLFLSVVFIAELPTAFVYYLTEKGYQKISGENEYISLFIFGTIIVVYAFLLFKKQE